MWSLKITPHFGLISYSYTSTLHNTCLMASLPGQRPFPVAVSWVWNSSSHHVTSTQSLRVFCSRLTTYLFRCSVPWRFCCAREVTLVIMDTLIVLTYLTWVSWYQKAEPLWVLMKQTRSIWKMLGPFATASRRYIASHQVSLVACQL